MYESWRHPWERYGALVQAVALSLESGVSSANRATVSAAAAAFQGKGEQFDPVAALVAPLLLSRSRGERRVAASVLVAHGIGEDRARVITGARGRLRHDVTAASAPPLIAFDELASAVGPLDSVQPVVTASPRRISAAAIAVSVSVSVMAAVGGVSWRAHHQRPGPAAYLLWPQRLPKPWVLVSARATGPIPMRIQAPLVQTLSSGYSISVQITIGDEVEQFSEPELGMVTDHSEHMADEAWFAAAHAQVTNMGKGRVEAHWREQGHNVVLESRGLSVAKIRSLVAGLVPQADFLRFGFDHPAWNESHTGGVGEPVLRDVRGLTWLVFRTTEQPQELVTVRAVPVSLASSPKRNIPVGGRALLIKRGITAYVRTGGPVSGVFWFDDKAGLVVNMMGNDQSPVAGIEELAKSLSVGDARKWLDAAGPFNLSLAAGTPTGTFTLGPLPVTVNANRSTDGTVCVLKICTTMDKQSSDAESADLIIAGHWWHLEHSLNALPAPTWRVVPATALAASYEIADTTGSFRWRALDLGTTGRAVRRGDDDFAFPRPLG